MDFIRMQQKALIDKELACYKEFERLWQTSMFSILELTSQGYDLIKLHQLALMSLSMTSPKTKLNVLVILETGREAKLYLDEFKQLVKNVRGIPLVSNDEHITFTDESHNGQTTVRVTTVHNLTNLRGNANSFILMIDVDVPPMLWLPLCIKTDHINLVKYSQTQTPQIDELCTMFGQGEHMFV